MGGKHKIVMEEAIASFCEKYPSAQQTFNNPSIEAFIKLVNIIFDATGEELASEDIWNFVEGLFLFPYTLMNDNKDMAEEVNKLTNPIFSLIISYLKSDMYQEDVVSATIDENEELNYNDLHTPITRLKILRFMSQHKKFAFTQEAVQAIEIDFIKWQKARNMPLIQQDEGDATLLTEPSNKVKAWKVLFEKNDDETIKNAISRISTDNKWKGSLDSLYNTYCVVKKIYATEKLGKRVKAKSDLFIAINLLSGIPREKAEKIYYKL